jgi:hypothetical protein
MGQVIASASMPLDGYIAKHDNTIGRLFDWLQNGEVPTQWEEAPPDAPFHFVTDGVQSAVAKAQQIAGEATVAVAAGKVAGQCLELGLLDAVAVDLVPVVMGQGRRYFGDLSSDVSLGDPIRCVQGDRVTHLVFPLAGSSTASTKGQR